MKAIILAAGDNSGDSDFFRNNPKCLTKINDSTLIEIQIEVLHKCGIKEINVVRGYEKEKINIPGITYYENPDFKKTNNLYSLFCAEDELNSEVLVLYSDIIYNEEVVNRFIDSKANFSLGIILNWKNHNSHRPNINVEDLELVNFDPESKILEIGKGKANLSYTTGQYIGISKISKKGCEILKNNYRFFRSLNISDKNVTNKTYKDAWLTDFYQFISTLGINLNCVLIEEGWMEISCKEDCEQILLNDKLIQGIKIIRTDWDKRAKLYNNLEWANNSNLLDQFVDWVNPEEGKNILDLGTGTGKVLIALNKKYPTCSYSGVDISQDMLDRIENYHGFFLKKEKIDSMEIFERNTFDYATARMVFHHVDNIPKTLSEIKRVLKPGGKLSICEGNPPDKDTVEWYEKMFYYKEDRNTFLLDDLINILVKADFQEITSKTIILKKMSLMNWLEHSALPVRNKEIIKKMHLECDDKVKDAYNMEIKENDVYMDWKFSIVTGINHLS
jgi:choline kinase/ubiquinone/menaquinone biosynthesis C-methylase UbiE